MSSSHQDAVDTLLLAGAALAAGGLAVVAPWEVVFAATAVLLAAKAAGRIGPGATAAVALAMALGWLRAADVVRRHEAERADANASMGPPARCSGRARVESSPVRVRDVLRWDAHLDKVSCDGRPLAWRGRATLYGGPDDLARGDEVDVVATLASPQRLWNASSGDPRPAEALRDIVRSGGTLDVRTVRRASGVLSWIDRVRAGVRRRIDATFAVDVAPMARALVLGESDLAPDDDRSFRASGLSHLLAVSGMHLVLVMALAVQALEGLLTRVEQIAARVDAGRIAAAIGVPVAWIYAELAGAGGSTVRAAWMATAALLARALGRRTDATRAFGLSRFQQYRHVILPIAFRFAVRPLGSVFVNLVLTTSVLSTITINDLMSNAENLASETFRPFETYLVVLVLYWLATFAVSAVVNLASALWLRRSADRVAVR